MLSQNQIALLINTFSQLTTNTNYVTTTRINASYKTTQSFNYEGNTVKPLLDIYSGNQVVILKDTSTGKYYAIREDFDPVLNERTFTRKYQEERKRKVPRQEADVAVLLCCEKNDTYEFWVTWLGNRRKNRFAYVGELPKRLQTEQYWAWESNSGGRFEFHPYAGATGGGISISTTPTNHYGAAIGAGAQGAYYQSVGFHGGGDIGGVVTPRWDRVLTDYTVTARALIQTLCYPLQMYTDVTWEWSDGGGGYALEKVGGDNVTVSSGDKELGIEWTVSWSYSGGGGQVTLVQDNPPVIRNYSLISGPVYVLYPPGEVPIYRSTSFTFSSQSRKKEVPPPPGVKVYYYFCWSGPDGTLLGDYDPNKGYEIGTVGLGYYGVRWTLDGELFGPQTGDIRVGTYAEEVAGYGCWTGYLWASLTLEIVFKTPDGESYDPYEYKLDVYSGEEGVWSSGWVDEPPQDPPTEEIPQSPTYVLEVYNESNVQVAYASASSPITSSVYKVEDRVASLYIRKDGENIRGRYTSENRRNIPQGFSIGDEVPHVSRSYKKGPGDPGLSVTGEVNLITAEIETWVEVAGKELAKNSISGKEGHAIVESSEFKEATKPYEGPGGRTVYPCYPQKSEPLQKEETVAFSLDDGFYAYHVTNYVTKDKDGLAEWVPFDFSDPTLSGYLPSPEINYLFSLVSTDLIVAFEPRGFISWGKDIPEEDLEAGQTTNLEEETEEGVDPYGVVYPLVFGFTYALYGPIKVSNILLSQLVDKDNDETLLSKYKKQDWEARARSRKPRLYALAPDNYKDGQPFEEFDYSDLNQRGLNRLERTMSSEFRRNLWDYDLSPIRNESNEDWAEERVTFAANPSGGDTPFERQYLNDETANSSTVKKRGDKTVDITVRMEDVEALLKKDKKGEVEFTIHDSQQLGKTTTQVFEMNPIRDVFDGYGDVKILAVAGVIY